MCDFEKWVWTELLAFDNREADLGVGKYCDLLGFVPDGMCLLVSAPDFVLLHDSLATERVMSPLICSRDAHEGNGERTRQEWTNWQIRNLVKNLTARNCRVFLSMFTVFHENKYHHEWLSDHPEALQVWVEHGRGLNFNVLARLKDGSLLENFFIPQTVRACVDYGFSGWHGPDGYGPLGTGNIWGTDMSDQMMRQFHQRHPDLEMPGFMLSEWRDDLGIVEKRARWLADHQKRRWIDFNVERWTGFWEKMSAALHCEKKQSVINSAWTKDNCEALYSYGINYQRLAAAGVDYMVVETVAAALSQQRPQLKKHYDFAATLFEIKAFAPDLKLVFLHGIKDVVECWDVLRNDPPACERELHALANMYFHTPARFARAVMGWLGCLADGIRVEEWREIRRGLQTAFHGDPIRAGQVTAVWSDELLEGWVDDYLQDGMWSSHWQIARLMENNVQIQSAVRLEDVGRVKGALYLPSAHLLPCARLDHLLSNATRPLVFSGRAEKLMPYYPMAEVVTDGQFVVLVFDEKRQGNLTRAPRGARLFEPNRKAIYFTEDLNRMDIADELFEKAAELINRAVTHDLRARHELFAECANVHRSDCTINTRLLDERTLDVAIENTTPLGQLVKRVRVSKPIESISILSRFPLRISRKLDDRSFEIAVPPRGVTVVRVSVIPEMSPPLPNPSSP